MQRRGVRIHAGWMLLVLLLSLLPGVAAANEEWKRVGQKIWLEGGQGINLTTGGKGTDLVFRGETVEAGVGFQVLKSSRSIDYDLVPPASGYVTSLATDSVVYSRIIVRLPDGGFAQVRFGMGSYSGFLYNGLFIEEWVVIKGSGQVAPVNRGQAKLKLDSTDAEANGKPVRLDVPPQRIDGHVMLPLRFVGESMNLGLVWNGREQKVSITGEGLAMTLWVGKTEAQIDGRTVQLPKAPTLVRNRLMVPLAVAGEALAGQAKVDAASGVITLGATGPAVTFAAAPGSATSGGPHWSAVWMNGYENGWISSKADARPDFHLTLNPDGTARVILTITGLIGANTYPVNLEYKGTYTKSPLRVTLKLQPALAGWETREHSAPYWQEMIVTGDLAADGSKIENLQVNGRAAKSGSATPAKRVPEPGEWR